MASDNAKVYNSINGQNTESKEAHNCHQVYDCHDKLLKLIDEIEEDGRPSRPKPKLKPKNFMKENIKKLQDLQLKRAEEKSKTVDDKIKNLEEMSKKVNKIKKSREMVKTADKSTFENSSTSFNGKKKSQKMVETTSKRTNHVSNITVESSKEGQNRYLKNMGKDKIKSLSYSQIHVKRNKAEITKEVVKNIKKKDALAMSYVVGYAAPISNSEPACEKAPELEKQEFEKVMEYVPPGKRLLSEEERLNTLNNLEKRREEIYFEISKLPIAYFTKRQERIKNELDRDLTYIEEAINVFSKPKIFIELDSDD